MNERLCGDMKEEMNPKGGKPGNAGEITILSTVQSINSFITIKLILIVHAISFRLLPWSNYSMKIISD